MTGGSDESNGFRPMEKGQGGTRFDEPVVSVTTQDTLIFLVVAYEAMGEPTAMKVYRDGGRVAFEPAHRGRRNETGVYLLNIRCGDTKSERRRKSASMSGGKITRVTGMESGTVYPLDHNEESGLWIPDLANPWGDR